MKKGAFILFAIVCAFALAAIPRAARAMEDDMINEVSAELCASDMIPTVASSIGMFHAYFEYDESTGMAFDEFSNAVAEEAAASVDGWEYADCAVTGVKELPCDGTAAIISDNNGYAVEDVLDVFDAIGVQSCIGFQVESLISGNDASTVDVYLVTELENGTPFVATTLVPPEE